MKQFKELFLGKTAKEIFDGLEDKSKVWAEIAKAISEPNVWQETNATHHYIFDGKNVYSQSVDGTGLYILNLNTLAENGTVTYYLVENGATKYFNGTEIKDAPEGGDADKLKRGYKYENHEWKQKEKTEVIDYQLKKNTFTDTDRQKAAEDAASSPNTWKSSGTLEAFFDGTSLYFQDTHGTAATKFNIEKYLADDDGAGNFIEALAGKYINGSGAEVPLPSDKTHIWDHETHEWKFDTNHAIGNLAPASALEKEGLKAHAANEGWTDNTKFPGWEGIKVGDMIYVQASANPDAVWVADLQKGTYLETKGKYFDGRTNTVTKVPPMLNRTEYDQSTKSWGKIEGQDVNNRKANRINEGKLVLDNLTKLDGVKTGDHQYSLKGELDAGRKEVVDIRFNTSNHQWEWRWNANIMANDDWDPMTVVPTIGSSTDVKLKTTLSDINDVRTSLLTVNLSNNTEAPST